jgi:hypothetical protein
MNCIGYIEAQRLFPKANPIDCTIASYCYPVPQNGGLIVTIIKRMIKLNRSDKYIQNMLETYTYEKKYETNITVSLTILFSVCISDVRLELADYILDITKAYDGLYKSVYNNISSIEISYLNNKDFNQNIAVIEYLLDKCKCLLSSYGYWVTITDDNVYILYYILARKDTCLAKWATGKMLDNTKNGFGYNTYLNKKDIKFVRRHLKLFNQRGTIFDNAMKMAIKNKDIKALQYLIRKQSKF